MILVLSSCNKFMYITTRFFLFAFQINSKPVRVEFKGMQIKLFSLLVFCTACRVFHQTRCRHSICNNTISKIVPNKILTIACLCFPANFRTTYSSINYLALLSIALRVALSCYSLSKPILNISTHYLLFLYIFLLLLQN